MVLEIEAVEAAFFIARKVNAKGTGPKILEVALAAWQ